VGQRLRGLNSKQRPADLQALVELIDEGKITPVIDRTYPLSEAAEAIRYLEMGHPAGKVVITVTPAEGHHPQGEKPESRPDS
jgi:NADPH:quinone reductase-like Zn-dependent oxidoreductase